MGKIADLKKPVRRLTLFDGTWYVVTISKEGVSMKPYKAKSGRRIIRSWREVAVQTDLPLYKKEVPNASNDRTEAQPDSPPHPED